MDFHSIELSTREKEIFYGIALSLVPGVGNLLTRNLISYCGSFEEVFKTGLSSIKKIPGVGEIIGNQIKQFKSFDQVEREMLFIEKNNIEVLLFTDKAYPQRMIHIHDSPCLIYSRGNVDYNAHRMLGIVGTRTPGIAAVHWTQELIESLKEQNITIVSGLAFGIDITAHKAAVKNKLPTIGVMASGFGMIYPAAHKRYISDICDHGSLLTESISTMLPDKARFPMRNRIIAALSDGLLVVESAEKGGSMITADFAFSYDRTLMALPGRPGDTMSRGCNALIKKQKATLVENVIDVIEAMNWDLQDSLTSNGYQATLFRQLTSKEQEIVDYLKIQQDVHIDELKRYAKINHSQFAAMLLALEMDGLITKMPGNKIALA